MSPKMKFNYRIVKKKGIVGVHEVYYRFGRPVACSDTPVTLEAETEGELAAALVLMGNALSRPVLDWKMFCKKEEKSS